MSKQSTLSENSSRISVLYNNPTWKSKIIKLTYKILRNVNIRFNDIKPILEGKKNTKARDSEQINAAGKSMISTEPLSLKNSTIRATRTDTKITDELRQLVKIPEQLYSDSHDFRRARNRWDNIKNHTTTKVTSMLDFGGNVGNTVFHIGRQILKLSKQNTYSADIPEWSGEKWVPREDITFVDANNLDQIPDNSIDMISAFHVLHHINAKEYSKILKHFHRILSPRGFIVIYEHDCTCANMAILIDIEHALYDVVVSKKNNWGEFTKHYYAKYLSIKKWQTMFGNAGFKKYHTTELKNIDNSFYMFFTK